MKNFLQVLLVSTILVSATDVYSQSVTGIWMDSQITSGTVEQVMENYYRDVVGVTDAAREMLRTNPVSRGVFDGITGLTEVRYNNNVLAYVKDGKWFTTPSAAGTGFKITDGKLDFSAPENLTITGTGGNSFNLGSSSNLDIRNAGLLDGKYTISNVKTPSGIVLDGQYTVKNLGNQQLQFTSADGNTVFVRDLKKNGWTITDGAITVDDYAGGNLEVKFANESVYYADNAGVGTNGASTKVAIGGRTYQTDGNKLVSDSVPSGGSSGGASASAADAGGSGGANQAGVKANSADPGAANQAGNNTNAGAVATPDSPYPPEGSGYYIGNETYEVGANGVVYDAYGNDVGTAFKNADGTDEIFFHEDMGLSSVKTTRFPPPKSTAKTPDVKKAPTVKPKPSVKAKSTTNLLIKKKPVQVAPKVPAQPKELSAKTSAGGVITKDLTTNQITYRASPTGPKYTLDSSQAYFVDAKGNPVIVSDPEAFTAFRETSYVDKIETQYGTFERTRSGTYVGATSNGGSLEVTPFAGKVDIGGVSYTVGTPSTMPAKVMSIDGGTATVNFNGIDYKISADALGGAQVGQAAQLSAEQVAQLGRGFGVYADGLLSGLGDTFGNFFDAAIGTVTMPFKMVGKVWDFGKTWTTKGWDAATKGTGAFFESMGTNFKANSLSGFTSFGQAWGVDKLSGLDVFAKTGDISKLGKDVFENTPKSIQDFIAKQQAEAAKMAKGEAVAAKDALKGLPVFVSNVAQYPIMILQTHESGNQKDTTKSVKVKSENALEASQGSTTDSTVGTTLDGTNMASAAVAMATLLKNNPVDLNLLKESDLDLTKDKDQKTLRQRRDLLLQMYAVSAQVIAEGSMAISSDFYDRINALSETLTETTGSLGAASVLNDSERYPYFEMVRQTALSATQLGLKGAATLPNLQVMHSYHINNNK